MLLLLILLFVPLINISININNVIEMNLYSFGPKIVIRLNSICLSQAHTSPLVKTLRIYT